LFVGVRGGTLAKEWAKYTIGEASPGPIAALPRESALPALSL
jgi:hypothetical protein